MTSPTERAEKISRRRALFTPALGLALLVVHQGVFFNWEAETVNYLATGVWAVLAIASLALVMTGGAWFVPKAVRDLANDEVTRDNWAHAIRSGFGIAMGVAILAFVLEPVFPLSAQRAAHLVFSAGVGTTLVFFGSREQKSLGR